MAGIVATVECNAGAFHRSSVNQILISDGITICFFWTGRGQTLCLFEMGEMLLIARSANEGGAKNKHLDDIIQETVGGLMFVLI